MVISFLFGFVLGALVFRGKYRQTKLIPSSYVAKVVRSPKWRP